MPPSAENGEPLLPMSESQDTLYHEAGEHDKRSYSGQSTAILSLLSLPFMGKSVRLRGFVMPILGLYAIIVVFTLGLLLSYTYWKHPYKTVSEHSVPPRIQLLSPFLRPSPAGGAPPAVETKPRVVGMVFFGRRSRVSILDCYLQKNLKRNGGPLDEVQFLQKTLDEEDIKYLDELVSKTDGYTKVLLKGEIDYHALHFSNAYEHLQRNTIYVKIDDDVVFIQDNAIANIVKLKSEHPEYLLVSANVVNSPLLSWVHYHLGVVHPFLPELVQPPNLDQETKTWEISNLPIWTGPDDYKMDIETPPPYMGHRWLPLKPGSNTDNTPIAESQYEPFGRGLYMWAMAAQEHYSLFQNLEKDRELKMYAFPTWETNYDRLSINFISFSGDDILDNGPVPEGDEEYLTQVLPKKLGRHVAVAGNAVVAHFSFGPQVIKNKQGTTGLEWTDVLERYRTYANQNICLTFFANKMGTNEAVA
ncbi:MAG: hypothetical protein M1829_005486 [Trizodia sp. TS-e1964]|nr:MAG: hypothetical protein M1829_005486 [Trizodia sp. TS-e1964]